MDLSLLKGGQGVLVVKATLQPGRTVVMVLQVKSLIRSRPPLSPD